jgi:nucleoid DNA-binding protein
MKSGRVKKLIKDISIEFKIKEEDIENIVKSPFYTLSESIRNSNRETVNFPSIRISGLGLFYCTEGRREFYRKLNNKNKENGRDKSRDKAE